MKRKLIIVAVLILTSAAIYAGPGLPTPPLPLKGGGGCWSGHWIWGAFGPMPILYWQPDC